MLWIRVFMILFKQEDAIRLSKMENIVIVCGHYEGIDQRFIDECVDEEISLGDFVLTGGEIAAMAVTDAVCRMVPGVLADAECFEDEILFSNHFAGCHFFYQRHCGKHPGYHRYGV